MKNPYKNRTLTEITTVLGGTTGHNKLVNYLKEIIKEKPFKKEVEEIRKKYNIDLENSKNFNGTGDLMDDIVLLLNKYHLEFECFDFMMFYVTHNEFAEELVGNMLFTEDIVDTKDNLLGTGNPTVEKLFPVVIRVSPYASERDIVDFVRKTYFDFIEPIQAKYRSKTTLGKVKNKKVFIQERNEFIYQNKDLPRKKIMELITDKYGADKTVDYAYIGKIISLEKKKRKEV